MSYDTQHPPHHDLHLFTPGTEPDIFGAENCPEKDGHKPFVSAGKQIHNELTYRGIDFLLNSAIGVAFTYWSKRTASGEKYFGKPVTGFFKKALSPFLKSPESLETGAHWGSMFTSIIVGGTTIIPPMVAMEDKQNKKRIVRALDNAIYGKDVVESDPKFEECYTCIDEEPRKNFMTGMAARFAVLGPMIAITLHDKTNAAMVKNLYNPIAKSSKWVCEKLGIQPKSLMERGRMELADGDVTAKQKFFSDWDFIHRTIGFDLGLTFIYSFAHEAMYKTLAAVGFRHTQEEKHSHAPAPAQPAPQAHHLANHLEHHPAERSKTFTQGGPKSLTDFALQTHGAEQAVSP